MCGYQDWRQAECRKLLTIKMHYEVLIIAIVFNALGEKTFQRLICLFVYTFWKNNPNLSLQKTLVLTLIEALKWVFPKS